MPAQEPLKGKESEMLIEMKVFGITLDPFTNAPIVILKDLEEKSTLPVWIGVLEASAIATELENVKFSRPMTHDLMKEILKESSVGVSRVEVNDLRDNVYYATIHLDSPEGTRELDARPSDAIALALRMDSPIFVDSTVMDKSKNMEMRESEKQDREASRQTGTRSKDLLDMLEELSPEDFSKYKM